MEIDLEKIKQILSEYNIVIDLELTDYEIIKLYEKIKKQFFIRDTQYNIIETKEYKNSTLLLPHNQRKAINDIRYRLEQNMSIAPYLTNNQFLEEKHKVDQLLDEHNIYHLHLGNLGKKEKKVRRTDNLLFITYDDKNIYFLKVIKHLVGSEWQKNEIIDIKNKYIK